MDEFFSNADPAILRILGTLAGLLPLAGLVSAFILTRHHRNNPSDRQSLDAQLADRSWSTMQMGIVLAAFFLFQFITVPLSALFHDHRDSLLQLISTLVIYGGTLGAVVLINRNQDGTWESAFGVGRRQRRTLLLAPMLYLTFFPILLITSWAYHLLLEQVFGLELDIQEAAKLILQESSWTKLLFILLAVVGAPLYEEILFRGLLFPYIAQRAGTAPAILLVSLLFALLHFHLASFVPLGLLSAVLCFTYWRTGSLWPGIGMHAIFNAVSILLLSMAG